ncbi:helix-turn-helix transcriptional regulator [Nonomuraea rhodomycinica]|uniref:AAA family ATPase n=1 Tax=Nonomuraea rhodomycinica TaxID=1712872 RepID=A0A7Y6MEK1_9ACTN|nr:LuxR family transcriptional regulator [Nonomuraea rhodomycinica]NUW44060.1 AAA family ATPase [Nonomuraea rhodomycinica]
MSAPRPATRPPAALCGRAEEEDAVRRILDRARHDDGGALALLGPPGIGKTAVLDLAVTLAGGFTVLRARGVPQETRLALAGLHALLWPVADRVGARVLRRALSLGVAGGGLALRAAFLEFLRELATVEPVLVCVDDAHLLDEDSRGVLSFAARRLAGERIAVLFAAREDAGLPDDVPARVLAPLDRTASRALADGLLPGRLSDDLHACLDRVARGNPLALRELVESLTPDQVAGLAAPPDRVPAGGRLHRAHAGRLACLPADTRFVLLLLAAHPPLDTATLIRAAEPADAPAVLVPAERAGVVRAEGERYVFADDMVRDVAYAEAPLTRRRDAHRLLAGLFGQGHDRLAGAWHRAAALDGPPERLAAELAAAASAVPHGAHPGGRPGSHPGPSLAFERAAELTGHPERRAEWLAAAAHHAWTAGDPRRAASLLSRLRGPVVPETSRARAELMRGRLELISGPAGSACGKLLAAAAHLLEGDRDAGVKALVHAAEASYRAGDLRTFLAIAGQAAVLRRADDCPAAQLMFEYLDGMAATFSGRHEDAAAPLRRVVELAPAVRSPTKLAWACVASLLLGEDAAALELSSRAVDTARRRGAVSVMPRLLEAMIQAHLSLGHYSSVAAHAAEGLRLARSSGQLNTAAQHLAWLALTAAVQGDAQSCRDHAHAAIDLADVNGLGITTTLGNWALAHLDLAAGRPADAAARLRGHRGNDHVVIRVMASPQFVEAAARTGDVERAGAALRVLDRWAGSTRSADRLALVARCRALLASPAEADELFQEALELHRQGLCRFETARTQLLYGGALRRQRRPGAAREHLHGALETFQRFGARLWAERAREELRASGETVAPARSAGAPEQVLTAQQLQIARLVAEGATNREVAARLFLSPRTIDHHLRNVFVRLGVRSRVELARLLA